MQDRNNARRASGPDEQGGPRIARYGNAWHVRSLAAAQEVLRARGKTSQAGFTSEAIPTGYLDHHPILISDGPLHDEQRREVGHFFAPRVITDRYARPIASTAAAFVNKAASRGYVTVDDVALLYSVDVARHIVGLTHAPLRAMAKRLEAFMNQPPVDITKPRWGRSARQWAAAAIHGLAPLGRFYLRDVRPAIAERRRRPRRDIISHLIDHGYTNADIFVECVTYATAGMVTTREFITMACWHLIDDPPLRQRYLAGDRAERIAILYEIIRLEPPVGHLYRRVREPLRVTDLDTTVNLPPGDLVDLHIRQTNIDTDAVGDDPMLLRPGRKLSPGTSPAGLSFGHGSHKCPGESLAIAETDAFVQRLLSAAPTIVSEPYIEWDDVIAGYRVRGLTVIFHQRPVGPNADAKRE